MSGVEHKLAAARTRLILDKPFLGALVLRLPMIETKSDWCPTTATDARSLYFNSDYIDQLSLPQVQFVLAHEALHCALSHFARREHRDRKRWDIACDYAVNQLLIDDGFEPVSGALHTPTYAGMTAEEIYPCIDSDDDEAPMDQHLYDGPDNAYPDHHDEVNSNRQRDPVDHEAPPPQPLSDSDRHRLDTQWTQRLAGAAQQAAQAGKLNGTMARLVSRFLQPTVPWRSLLSRHMNSAARIDYNLMRPSQRRESDAILPSLHSRLIDIVIALDTSGSIKQVELDAFVSEINAIKGSLNARVTLHACDAALDSAGPWIFESWEPMRLPQRLSGGGGTDFTPVFDWVAMQHPQPDLLIYFTDARGIYPQKRPAVDTLWLVKGQATVPWGQRIQLN